MLSSDRLTELRPDAAAELLADLTPPCSAVNSGQPCPIPAVWVAEVRCPDSHTWRGALCDRHATDATAGRMMCQAHIPTRVALLALERL